MKKITIDTVAKHAGVSKSTVSAVINAKGNVKQITRDHILNIMKELNFRPTGIARNLKNKALEKSIGIIIKDLRYPFFTSIAFGAMEYANSKGYSTFIVSSENDHETEKKYLQLFSFTGIKGAIIAPIVKPESEIEHLFKLKMINYPFVLLADVQGIQANVVAIDNIRAIRRAVKFLIDCGHKKIIHFAGDPYSSHTKERIDGFKEAFSESNLIFEKKMVIPIGSFYNESFTNSMKYFKGIKQKDLPTAIVCFNDQQAVAVMAALKELNIKVPDDISIIGNDDISYADIYPIPLTTIRAPQHEIGKRAAEILIRNIESTLILPMEKLLLDTEFIIRESTKNHPIY
ncbi:MAG: LacI family DNA-binding transcriptional regulator [Ignavibacteriae bacterium]|nr:LacI family DNA-binding transcriptional regulator [Ignavibacteriota bacterium]